MSAHNHVPDTVSASLEARLAPFQANIGADAQPRLGLFRDLKLLFAALGAGSGAVPMGDNSRTTQLLAEYAASLRDH